MLSEHVCSFSRNNHFILTHSLNLIDDSFQLMIEVVNRNSDITGQSVFFYCEKTFTKFKHFLLSSESLDIHYYQITFTILGKVNRLSCCFTESRDLIIILSDIGAWSNIHKKHLVALF